MILEYIFKSYNSFYNYVNTNKFRDFLDTHKDKIKMKHINCLNKIDDSIMIDLLNKYKNCAKLIKENQN
jgi:hypothetical protein